MRFNTGLEQDMLEADTKKHLDNGELHYPAWSSSCIPGTVSFPEHRACLKKSCIVMLLRVQQLRTEPLNRARYMFKSMTYKASFHRIASRNDMGSRSTIQRIACDPVYDELQVTGFWWTPSHQILVDPALDKVFFAFTTNKVQWQTFSEPLGLNLCQECFTPGNICMEPSSTIPLSNIYILNRTLKMFEKNRGAKFCT